MRGIPAVLQTRADWLQAVDYAIAEVHGKKEMAQRLKDLKQTKTRLVLKAGAKSKKPEDQTVKDFEEEIDGSSAFVKSGLTNEDIVVMIEKLEA